MSLENIGQIPVWHVSLKPVDGKTINTRDYVYFSPEQAAFAAMLLVEKATEPIAAVYVSRFLGSINKPADSEEVQGKMLKEEGLALGRAVEIFGFPLLSSQRVHTWSLEMIKALRDAHINHEHLSVDGEQVAEDR